MGGAVSKKIEEVGDVAGDAIDDVGDGLRKVLNGSRIKVKPKHVLKNPALKTSNTYQPLWVLNPEKPDRYFRHKRLDKFREIDEVTKPVWAIDFAECACVLAAALADSNVHLWDLLMDPPELKVTLRAHDAHVWDVLFSPNELVLATASSDKTVRLWAAENGEPLHVLEAHTEGVRCLAFSMDGLLLSGGMDSQICLWEYESTVPTAQWRAHDGHVHGISFIPRESRLRKSPTRHVALSVGTDGAACAWHIEPGSYTPLGKFPGGGGKGVLCVALHTSEENWCACGNEDGAVWIWNFQPPDEEGGTEQMEVVGNLKLVGHKSAVRTLAFNPDGCVLASGSTDGQIRVWDVRKMVDPEHEVVLVCVFKAHDSWITQLRFEGTNRAICSCSSDGLVKYWNPPGRVRKLVRGPKQELAMPSEEDEDDEEFIKEMHSTDITSWSKKKAPTQLSDFSRRQLVQVGALFGSEEGEFGEEAFEQVEETGEEEPDDLDDGSFSVALPMTMLRRPSNMSQGSASSAVAAKAKARVMRAPAPVKKTATSGSSGSGQRSSLSSSPGRAASGGDRGDGQIATVNFASSADELHSVPSIPGVPPPRPPPPPPRGGPVSPQGAAKGRIDPRSNGRLLDAYAASRVVVPPHRQTPPRILGGTAASAAPSGPPSEVQLAH